ncbi:tyrosine-type recombinase/integrase [Nonomuraea africana]|uniref:Tyr recombinase domain-containing protein n=1 Tax=Nonomuraea africana TaxID=46171 RepID=A0ABR9KI81_9ACTN|nr:tyrosine-type recombinase/integrase [Nonomuraea africana]MBE1561670.1 hypothetical protein [Nonomuraea africana]
MGVISGDRPKIPGRRNQENRKHGMHALRHYFASVLLDAGESIKALADYLGHQNPGYTLRTYTHLMPGSEGRTRSAIDQTFSREDPKTGTEPDSRLNDQGIGSSAACICHTYDV